MKLLLINDEIWYNLSNILTMSKDCSYNYHNFILNMGEKLLVFKFDSEDELIKFETEIIDFCKSDLKIKKMENSLIDLPQ